MNPVKVWAKKIRAFTLIHIFGKNYRIIPLAPLSTFTIVL